MSKQELLIQLMIEDKIILELAQYEEKLATYGGIYVNKSSRRAEDQEHEWGGNQGVSIFSPSFSGATE